MIDVFISWSGPRSKHVAEALRSWLPVVVQAINPWLSSSDIEAGARWAADVAGKLSVSKVGILCLAASNLESIWVHFEAGALAKTLESTFVIPYLVDIEPGEIKGPLAQFQALKADQSGTRKLLETVNSTLGESALKSDTLREAFEMAWPRLKAKLAPPVPIEVLVMNAVEYWKRQSKDRMNPTNDDLDAFIKAYLSANGFSPDDALVRSLVEGLV